ncbi:MAG: recombinase family protein [Alphaproteobacteria bacterium]|nr:recombinase family protein [Alphaproteobacteria bacterium]
MKVALYLRVSTARQAEKDLSIPEQRHQCEARCRERGWTVVAEYVEPGASATDDKRPQFRRMMADATRRDHPFDAILVYSYSRFFRESFKFELHRRALEKNDVLLISITQAVSDDPGGRMLRGMMSVLDQYDSESKALVVSGAMIANAKLGFWNGARPPFGYRAVTVEIRGDAHKKKLEIDPAEAAIVRMIFDLYREDMGIRAIAHELNRRGIGYRTGIFTSTRVHEILTREAYAGRHYFNRKDSRSGKTKDRAEWIPFETPVIIDPVEFRAVQKQLEARRPARTPPRVVNGPTLLTGLVKCASCGGGMTLRTGKGGRYRYYACHSAMHKGKTHCAGRSVPMPVLDDLVVTQLEQKIFAPERLETLLSALIARTKDRSRDTAARAKELRKELAATEGKIERLYDALAEGVFADNELFRKSLTRHEAQREETLRLIAGLEQQRELPRKMLGKANLARFAAAARAQLRAEDATLRKGYVRQFLERIDVDDGEIRLRGSRAALASGLLPPAGNGGAATVPGFVPEWWARQGSNL